MDQQPENCSLDAASRRRDTFSPVTVVALAVSTVRRGSTRASAPTRSCSRQLDATFTPGGAYSARSPRPRHAQGWPAWHLGPRVPLPSAADRLASSGNLIGAIRVNCGRVTGQYSGCPGQRAGARVSRRWRLACSGPGNSSRPTPVRGPA